MSPSKSNRSLAQIAVLVAVATLFSKVSGLLRQQVLAAVFGVGPAVDAYSYAYVVPGFLLILLGGINGPFHSAIVSVLAKRQAKDAAEVVETITTLVTVVFVAVTLLLIGFADPLIHFVAPGLGSTPQGAEVHRIAVDQLRIMAPMAVFAGLIGIGFGVLNATDQYWLPSISPIISSLTVLMGIGGLAISLGPAVLEPAYVVLGGQVLAWSTLAGAVGQWLIQLPAQASVGLGRLRLRWAWGDPGVQDVVRLLIPATLSSGMLHINVYVDLFFASYIPQAAAALGYAQLLIQAPLGILSNMILVPFLPVFARLAAPEHWPELRQRIRQSLVYVALVMLPLGTLTCTLGLPIVRLIYERYAFDRQASLLVAEVLAAYGVGMFVYLARDVLVRVFYALGDGQTPFRVSMVGIGLNALGDALLVGPLGAGGIALATAAVNAVALLLLLVILERRIGGLPWQAWGQVIAVLTGISAVAGVVSWGVWAALPVSLTHSFVGLTLGLSLASAAGLGVFSGGVMTLKLPEAQELVGLVTRRLRR
ncbi:MAG: murein biosynthesis integral membrane protein MurJ [Gloeomargaritaceae cyanobacterium C42_A2020_066]|nr:murein biosynthesis integral membrane protein MurJ [Gloeomargaritaceae cyanobacterium C42_A2020_066]